MSFESSRTSLPPKNPESLDGEVPELAEGVDKDPRVAGIRTELILNWEKQYGKGEKIMESGEGQDYMYGDPLAYKRGEQPLSIDQRAEAEFAKRFPVDAALYREKEKTRIYEKGSDPLLKKINRDIHTTAYRNLENDQSGRNGAYAKREVESDYFKALKMNTQIVEWRTWNNFLFEYPEKALAYRHKNSDISDAFHRRELSEIRAEKADKDAISDAALEAENAKYRLEHPTEFTANGMRIIQDEQLSPAKPPKNIVPVNNVEEVSSIDNGTEAQNTIPRQYAGMTAEAVDIAWTVTQNVDPEKTKREQERKEHALTFLRTQETGNSSQAPTAEQNLEAQPEEEAVHAKKSEHEIETLLAQSNAAEAIRKATERLAVNTEFDELAFQKEINTFLRRRSWLHNELTRRGSEDLGWMLEDYAPHSTWYQDAKEALDTHFINEGIKTAETPAWFSITASERRAGNESSSRYKVYETLAVNDYQSIAKLPALVKKLQAIGAETGESIKIKTPRSFIGFITDNDTLVAHCDSEVTCYKIKQAIAEWQSEQGLTPTTRELGRTTIALDGKINEINEDTSFSELVSNQITTWAKEHKDNYPADLLAKEAIKHAIQLSQKAPIPPTKFGLYE